MLLRYRRTLAFACAAFLALLVLACGSTPSGSSGGTASGGAAAATSAPASAAPATATSAATGPGTIGDRIEANGMALTVVKMERADTLGQFLKAKDGNTFVVAEVLIENVSQDKIPYNLLYFKVKDSDGFEYTPAIGVDQPLNSGELTKGDKARGNVAFEVKKDAKGLVLTYKPITLGNETPIQVALSE